MAAGDADQRRKAERIKALRRGRFSEYLAALALVLRGYRILAMRYRVKAGEIDIIARKGDLVSFVEVKARARLEQALTAVTARKQRLVERRVRQWLARNPWAMGYDLRADAVFLAPWHRPRHVPAAFELVL